jgi:hypothetical protein
VSVSGVGDQGNRGLHKRRLGPSQPLFDAGVKTMRREMKPTKLEALGQSPGDARAVEASILGRSYQSSFAKRPSDKMMVQRSRQGV